MKKITVRVPATTANIGPGFDSMGCALALYNTITCEMLPENKLIVTGCPQQYRNDENLAVQGYRAMIGFLPEQKFGVVMLWNCESATPSGLMPMLFDRYLGLPAVDWAGVGMALKARNNGGSS